MRQSKQKKHSENLQSLTILLVLGY